MANLALEVAQLEALKAAWRWTPAGRLYAQRQAVASAGHKAEKAAVARTRRAARAYLAPDVVLPLGVPAVESMREAPKLPCARYDLWPEHAPAHGCREIRGAAGVHEVVEERQNQRYFAWTKATGDGWLATVKVSDQPLPTD